MPRPARVTLSLKHFILKQRVLSLYRTAIRASRVIPDPATRKETLSWIRAEFERNKHIVDLDLIGAKLRAGRRELEQILPYPTERYPAS
ncbi:complex 1 protein-domain-containing protein [Russula earlei]|uniref:Complex 1 protein-domain-containing protein n=1 Tax=Russula earlei TaxID=71964 RepID=A0ACC0UNJ5_9AGAM|nr:complex 1 protein-domain-containing protein [Russula earlei]